MEETHLGLKFDSSAYVGLLKTLISESEQVQNNPPSTVPREDLIVGHVLDFLGFDFEEAGKEEGAESEGVRAYRISYVDGRSNLILEYGANGGTDFSRSTPPAASFVGAHMDVVTADPTTWTVPPFTLTQDGDKLFGRGTTDCLGHVALLALIFRELSTTKPKLGKRIVAVLIADEEDGSGNCGVERLAEDNKLGLLEGGPLLWLDASDMQPWIGTGGALTWRLVAQGKLTHSGFPQNAVNALELAMDAITAIQKRFHNDFPPDPREKEWCFPESGSSMKPTSWSCPKGSLNAIRGEATIEGDIRLTPFYSMEEVMSKVLGYVEDLNNSINSLVLPDRTRGSSHYDLSANETAGRPVGKLRMEWIGEPMVGVACDKESRGYKALRDALGESGGNPAPYACTGSLPLVAGLKERGFDLQITGFGVGAVYHGNDEYCTLTGMEVGFKTLTRMLDFLSK